MPIDKVILITGASRGLGKATAKCLSQLGCSLALCARSPQLKEAYWFNDLPESRRLYASVDLQKPQEIEDFVQKVREKFGRLDVLVNCASILGTLTTIASSTTGEWQEAVATNILGSALMSKTCLPLIRQSRGGIIQVISSAGLIPISHCSTYCITKAAQIMLTRTLAAEEQEITAVNYDPSMMDTDMQAAIRTKVVPNLPDAFKQYFIPAYEKGLVNDLDTSGCTLAWLICHLAPNMHSLTINGGDPKLQYTAQKWLQSHI